MQYCMANNSRLALLRATFPCGATEGDPLRNASTPGPVTTLDYIRQAVATSPDTPAVIHGNESMTYGALWDAAAGVAHLLQAKGARPGARVVYVGRNTERFFPVLVGSLRGGYTLTPLNWRLTSDELSPMLSDAEPTIVIADEEFATNVLAAIESASLSVDFLTSEAVHTAAHGTPHELPSDPDLDVPALLMYTSGTTGAPKGVLVTHRMLAATHRAERLTGRWPMSGDDVLVSPLPLCHIGGLGWALVGLTHGVTGVYTKDAQPGTILDVCTDYSSVYLYVVPALIRGLLDAVKARGQAMTSVRSVSYGSMAMDPELLRELIETFNCALSASYGMTENSGAVAFLAAEDHDLSRPELLRSVGRPLPGVEVEIRDSQGRAAPIAEMGEIWIRSATLMDGYLNRPDATEEVLVDGWYRTGDAGHVDADGYLVLTGRLKDMINSGGEKFSPAEIEAVLMRHEAVAEAGVVGIPDPKWGEAVAAVLTLAPGREVSMEQLEEYLRQHLAGFKVPRTIVVAPSLPKTSVGKLQRADLRTLVLDNEGQPEGK